MHNPLSRPGGRRTARRAAALGATAALVAGLTTACGGASGSSSKTALGPNDTLKITTFSDFGYDKLIDEWNADPKHPFLVKQTKIADWDPWKQTLTSDLQAGTGLPDIVAIEGDSMPEFLAPGASDQFVDLSDPSLANRWLEYKYKAGQTADGKQIGYPTDAGPEAFCYNADLFKKAGFPTDRDQVAKVFSSWNSYFDYGVRFERSVPGAKWIDDSVSIAQAMLNQTKYPFQTADNKVNVNNNELRTVFDTVARYAPTLSTGTQQGTPDWTKDMADGKVATMPCPGWMFANIKAAAPHSTSWDIADAFPGGGGNWGGSFLAVPRQSKHPAEAKRFANWLTDKEQEVAAFKAAGNYPANVAAEQVLTAQNATDAYFHGAPTSKILADRAKAVDPKLPYKGDEYAEILGLFKSAVQRVDQGKPADESWRLFLQAVAGLS